MTSQEQVAIVNRSTVVSDGDLEVAVGALQTQVNDHFQASWGRGAELEFVSTQDPDPTGLWQIVVTDDPTMAGALGYHDLTNDGLPIGYVFAKLDLQAGLS